ncbi:MAG: hypothetical protein IKT40_03585 [Bacilli bacterium]|nr:hypothetical protein [Bacilli bacterium]
MKTLEELFIKKYQDLEKEKKSLEELIQEEDKYKNKFIELVNRLKEDFKIVLKKDCEGNPFIKAEENYIWATWQEEQYNYYKNIFDLKEEGEK